MLLRRVVYTFKHRAYVHISSRSRTLLFAHFKGPGREDLGASLFAHGKHVPPPGIILVTVSFNVPVGFSSEHLPRLFLSDYSRNDRLPTSVLRPAKRFQTPSETQAPAVLLERLAKRLQSSRLTSEKRQNLSPTSRSSRASETTEYKYLLQADNEDRGIYVG